MDDLLTTYLHGRDEPCPNCAYNLRDLASDACPECGLRVVLGVHLAEPKLAAFIVGLVLLAMSLGFSVIFLVILLLVSLVERGGPLDEILIALLPPAMVSLAAMLVWIRARPRVRRMSVKARWLAAACCVAVPLCNVVYFLAVVPR